MSDEIRYEELSQKSFAVFGNKNKHGQSLKDIGAVWNPRLKPQPGWFIGKEHEDKLKNIIKTFNNTQLNSVKQEITENVKRKEPEVVSRRDPEVIRHKHKEPEDKDSEPLDNGKNIEDINPERRREPEEARREEARREEVRREEARREEVRREEARREEVRREEVRRREPEEVRR